MTPLFSMKQMITSEHAETEVWDLLSLNIIEQRLKNNTGYILKKHLIDTIRTLLNQSKELFKASGTVSLECSPLIDFYSYSMLSKLLIIKNQKKGLETFPQSHGLTFQLDNSKDINTDNVYVEIAKNGTFIELLKSLKRINQVKDYYNFKVSLTELLRYNADLYDYLPFESKCLPICDWTSPDLVDALLS